MRAWMAAAVLCGMGGCATTLRPPAQHFSGNPYDITAHHGVIAGEVCGVGIDYAVSRDGDTTVLLGPGTRRLAVRELGGGALRITGVLNGNLLMNAVVDLRIAPDGIVGRIGPRELRLTAVGDGYRGSYAFPEVGRGGKTDDVGDIEIAGRDEMLLLPHEALAAVAPGLLTCDRRGWARHPPRLFHPPIAVRFGGPAHYETTAAR